MFKKGDLVYIKDWEKRPWYWNDEMVQCKNTVQKVRDKWAGIVCVERAAEKEGKRWIFGEEDIIPFPEPGEKVWLKNREELEKQYEPKEMWIFGSDYPLHKKLCGKLLTVEATDQKNALLAAKCEETTWLVPMWAVREVLKKEEKDPEERTPAEEKARKHYEKIEEIIAWLSENEYTVEASRRFFEEAKKIAENTTKIQKTDINEEIYMPLKRKVNAWFYGNTGE